MNEIHKSVTYIHLNENERLAKRIINDNQAEFQEYLNNKSKLGAVKAIKDYTGLGLREAKQVIDRFWDSNLLIVDVKEDRRLKLEKLAKIPLVENIVDKINNLDKDKLQKIFLNLSIDELFNIDELLEE